MDARTRFIDGQLVEALEAGIDQIVIVGAGYDGRALRFSNAKVKWVEVDHPATQADKLRRLARIGADTGHIAFVAVDLLDDDLAAKLDTAGHDPSLSTLWVCEGLLPYLPRPAIQALCRTLAARSGPRSVLVVNVLVTGTLTALTRVVRRGVDRLLASLGERRLSEFAPGDVEKFLAETGWQVQAHEATAPGRVDGAYLLCLTAHLASAPP